jgi:hypothetical protein
LSLLTAIKQWIKCSKRVLQAAATHEGVGFARSELVVVALVLTVRVFFESCCRRSGAVRLPFETEGTINGREQFGCSLQRKTPTPNSKLDRGGTNSA